MIFGKKTKTKVEISWSVFLFSTRQLKMLNVITD
jgi:hypothetical protein